MKDYQAIVMDYLWDTGEEGSNSRDAWLHVSKVLREEDRSISRASIIFFMNDMVDEGVLKYREKSGKGGYHRIYAPVYCEEGFKEYLVKQIMNKLLEEFPKESKKFLSRSATNLF
ncbi:BlaI/MecI/CopY family transcriptional regulator [Patescibacteria group bacterium]|nr:BlaI/MecI/CopY family transcriptional regulator [Patescibacteria group bacterium]